MTAETGWKALTQEQYAGSVRQTVAKPKTKPRAHCRNKRLSHKPEYD